MKLTLITTIIAFISFTVVASQNPVYHVTSFKIPLMVESKNSGRFISLINEIERTQEIKINLDVYPAKRTIQKFMNKEVLCFFPLVGEMKFPFEVIKTKSFYLKKDYIFYRTGEKSPNNKNLIGKEVGLTAGYPYPPSLLNNKKINFQFAESDESNIAKLALKRIDYFVVENLSGRKAIVNSGLAESISVSKNMVGSQKVYVACHKLAETEKLISILNNAFDLFEKNGYFKKLFPENY